MRRFLTIALALVMMLTVCAFAIELDTAEAAVNEEAALFSAVTDPASEVHPTYGKLVFYQDFEGSDKSPTYVDPIVLANTHNTWDYRYINCAGSVVVDPFTEGSTNHVVEIKGKSGGSYYPRIQLDPETRGVYGEYTIVADFYTLSTNTVGSVRSMTYLNNTQVAVNFANLDKKDQWVRDSKSHTFNLVAEGHQKPASSIGSEITEIYFVNSAGDIKEGECIYFDNIKIYYKKKTQLTYNYGILPENIASTKAQYEYLVPGAALPTTNTALGYHFLGWTLDSTPGEDSQLITTAPDEDTTVYAVWRKYQPGINPMTGTSAAVDFEDGDTHNIIINYKNHKETVVDNSVENAGNAEGAVVNTSKVLKSTVNYTSGQTSAYRSLHFPVGFEKGRKYELQYDVFFTDINSYMTTWHYSVFTSTSTPTDIKKVDTSLPNNAPWMTNNKDGKWYHLKYTFQPTIDYADKIYFQQKTYSDWVGSPEHTAIYDKSVGADGKAVYTLKEGVTDEQLAAAQKTHATRCIQTIYYDNVSYLPYYMITFYNTDGSVYATEQVLRDTEGNLLTSYEIPSAKTLADTDTQKFMGWSTEEGAAVAMTSVALENEDVALYPVYNDLYAISYYGFDGEVVKSEKVLAGEYTLDLVLEDENGKYFEGWKVEGTEDVVTSVNVTADVNFYPVFTDKTGEVEIVEEQEMRFDGDNATASIRFKSVITAEEKNEADEFGFIVTRKSYLDKMAELGTADETLETELTFDFKYNGADLFVSGMAYQKDENGVITVEKIVEEDENGNSIFATVLTGIDNTKADHVNETMVVRPYVKFTKDGKQFTFYGDTTENSLVGVAKNVDTTELPENVKASIEAIVALEK